MQPYPTVQSYGYSPYWMNGQNPNNYYNYAPVQTQMSGKYVNEFNEVTANDVPMDGKSAVFVKNDRSEIQVREWNPNGQITMTSYLPQISKKDDEVDKLSNETQKSKFDPKSEVLEPLFERLEQLENKIDRIGKTSRVKKEVVDE